jgi:hypothetical protein
MTPMIYTTKGNLPISDLAYATRWEVTDDYTKLVETYSLGDEVVRESAHVLTKRGLTAEPIAQTLN